MLRPQQLSIGIKQFNDFLANLLAENYGRIGRATIFDRALSEEETKNCPRNSFVTKKFR